MKILEQLWYDGLRPSESLTSDSDYKNHLYIVLENEDKFLSMLPEEVRETYEKLDSSREELSVTERAQIFTAGFRMGARIMLEVMEGKK